MTFGAQVKSWVQKGQSHILAVVWQWGSFRWGGYARCGISHLHRFLLWEEHLANL